MKRYYSYFRSCDTSVDRDGQLYMVTIDVKNSLGEKEYITLTDEPFTVDYEGEIENVQKPYKCSTASVNFLYETFNPDFTRTEDNNIVVTLLKWRNTNRHISNNSWKYDYTTIEGVRKNDTIVIEDDSYEYPYDENLWETEWVGFATPNSYNQAFEGIFDTITINAQDALSTLANYDYTVEGRYEVASFFYILNRCVSQLGVIKNILVTDSVKLNNIEDKSIIETILVHERNFFDEDEEPMTFLEVISYFCNYLNVTLMQKGNSLLFLNYDGIKNGFNEYYLLKKDEDVWSTSKVTLTSDINLTKDDFAENGTSLSVIDPYKSIKVTNDIYPTIPITPEWDDVGVLTNSIDEAPTIVGDNLIKITNTSRTFNLIDRHNGYKDITFFQYLGFPSEKNGVQFKSYWYPIDTGLTDSDNKWKLQINETPNESINNNKNWCYDTTLDYVGCCLMKTERQELDKVENKAKSKTLFKPTSYIAIFQPIPQNYWKEMHVDGTGTQQRGKYFEHNYKPFQRPCQPMFIITAVNESIDIKTSIIIKGSFKFYSHQYVLPLIWENQEKANSANCYVYAQLKLGNLYYNENEEWSTSQDYFILRLEYEDNKNAYDTEYRIVGADGESDFEVKVPNAFFRDNSEVKVIQLEFTLYRPICPAKEALSPITLLKDFEISLKRNTKVHFADSWELINGDDLQPEYITGTTDILRYEVAVGEEKTSEVELSTKLDNKSFEKLPDVDNKIYSNINNVRNYGNALTSYYNSTDGNPLFYTSTIYNRGFGTVLLPEMAKLTSLKSQYISPTITLTANLKNSLDVEPWSRVYYHYFKDKTFLPNTMSFDYRWNKTTVELFETKSNSALESITINGKERDYKRNGNIAKIGDSNTIYTDTINYNIVDDSSSVWQMNSQGYLEYIGDTNKSVDSISVDDYNNISINYNPYIYIKIDSTPVYLVADIPSEIPNKNYLFNINETTGEFYIYKQN